MIKIGDFAHLVQVSVVTLRHYDEIGLFKPALVDGQTDYREPKNGAAPAKRAGAAPFLANKECAYPAPAINPGTTCRMMLAGMAKPTPAPLPLVLSMALFTPTTWPCRLSSGPPELPGLMGASV